MALRYMLAHVLSPVAAGMGHFCRSILHLLVVCVTVAQQLTLALLCSTRMGRGLSSSLPFSSAQVSNSSTSSSSRLYASWFLISSWFRSRTNGVGGGGGGTRKDSNVAIEFLEKLRQGPETQSEWDIFLWRVTFPLVALVIATILAVLGKFGVAMYSFVVCPVWYFCNFVLLVYPFFLVFHFPALDEVAEARIWKVLTVASVGVGSLEWYLSNTRSKASWIAGNTLFGVMLLVTIPLFFTIQKRVARDHYDVLVDDEYQQQYQNSIRHDSPVLSALDKNSPRNSSSGSLHNVSLYSPRKSAPSTPTHRFRTTNEQQFDDETTSFTSTSTPPGSTSSNRRHSKVSSATPKAPTPYKQLMICAVCIAVVWITMFLSYYSNSGATAATGYWFLLYALSPIVCIALFCARQRGARFSFQHVIMYGVVIVHIPMFLGQLCVRLFAMAEDAGSNDQWFKFGISILYLLMMQGYFFVITHIVNCMAEPYSHPSLLYVGQLYYYLFWYILVGSDTPIDSLYWGMLLVNNVHIAFLNTGVYTDVTRSSRGCLTIPFNMIVGSSVAMCFSASRSAKKSFSPTDRSYVHLTPQANSRTAFSLDDWQPDDQLEIGEGEDDDLQAQMDSFVRGGGPASLLTPISTTESNSMVNCTTSLRNKCSSSTSPCRNTLSNSAHLGSKSIKPSSTFASSSTITTSENLRPLYFLMKVAEQDNMADTTALILVPSLLTLLAVFDKPSQGFAVIYDQMNMWMRCICMFIGRLGGSYLAREIFAYKLRTRLRNSSRSMDDDDPTMGTIDGMSTRLWIQRLMLQDFHRQFWYLTAVTLVVTFACFDRVDLPLRFALLT